MARRPLCNEMLFSNAMQDKHYNNVPAHEKSHRAPLEDVDLAFLFSQPAPTSTSLCTAFAASHYRCRSLRLVMLGRPLSDYSLPLLFHTPLVPCRPSTFCRSIHHHRDHVEMGSAHLDRHLRACAGGALASARGMFLHAFLMVLYPAPRLFILIVSRRGRAEQASGCIDLPIDLIDSGGGG